MKALKRAVSLLLAAVLVLSVCQPMLLEATASRPRTESPWVWIPNPLYPDRPAPPMPRVGLSTAAASEDAEYLELAEAAALMRQAMTVRTETIEVRVVMEETDPRLIGRNLSDVLMDAVFAHTGNPVEGDYLQLHFAGSYSGGSNFARDGKVYLSSTFHMSYYTTAQQEQELDGAVEQLLSELALEGLTEYQKTRKIYDYITANVRYDYAHVDDQEYPLQYSAYAALIQGTAVCQGYASLLYRLLLAADVDCRCISGDAGGPHSWNIIRLGDRYYYADATWDENVPPSRYRFFLKGSSFTSDHRANGEYLTQEFQNAYPMSPTDYDPNAHSHLYTKEETLPDCDTDGYITFTCDCGYSFIRWTEPALGHAWDEGTVISEPTQDTEGLMRYRCVRCGAERTEAIDRLPHTHHYTAAVTEPSCTEGGYTTYTCTCGHSYTADETPALGHTWDEGTEQGSEILFTCLVCGETKTESAGRPPHVHSYESVVIAPKCDAAGYALHFCRCGDGYSTDVTEATGHTLTVLEVVKPTCERMGYTEYQCSTCGANLKGGYASQLLHQWELDWRGNGIWCYVCSGCENTMMFGSPMDQEHSFRQVAAVDADCSNPGYAQYECSVCWSRYQEDIQDPLGHDYFKTVELPNCYREGTMTCWCSCGETFTESFAPAFDHSLYTQTVAPTCTESGYTLTLCDFCYYEDWTNPVDPLGHDYVQTSYPGTCKDYGYTEFVCRNCGEGYVERTEELGDHVWDEGYVTKEPTMSEPGEIRWFCQICGTLRWEELPRLSLPFVDVEEGAYYYDPVFWAVQECVTAGTDPTHFSPNATCTRGQVVTFLWRAAGCPEPSAAANPFTDVKPEHYFYKSVLWAVQQGITQGVGSGRFAPDQEVTRGQFVTFLWRWGGQVVMPLMEGRFSDVRNNAYYCNAVNWAVENAVTAGLSADRFGPDQGCTRAQVVTFLYRYSRSEATATDWYQIPEGVELHRMEQWQPQKFTALSALPVWSAETTEDNVLAVLENCSPDSAAFLRWNGECYHSYLEASETLIDKLEMAAHETYHLFASPDTRTERSYLGYGYYVDMPMTATFRTEQIGAWIPEELHTFRYDLYVTGYNSFSNGHGIYGLMDEFNAYWLGTHHSISMLDYYCQQGKEVDVWLKYLEGCENGMNAYAEFLYWMLTYLMYAREHYPSQYQAFMDNTALRYAFTVVEGRYAENIAIYEDQLNRLAQNRIPGMEHYFSIEGQVIYVGRLHHNSMTGDYRLLMQELLKPEYQQMLETFRLQ